MPGYVVPLLISFVILTFVLKRVARLRELPTCPVPSRIMPLPGDDEDDFEMRMTTASTWGTDKVVLHKPLYRK